MVAQSDLELSYKKQTTHNERDKLSVFDYISYKYLKNQYYMKMWLLAEQGAS